MQLCRHDMSSHNPRCELWNAAGSPGALAGMMKEWLIKDMSQGSFGLPTFCEELRGFKL